MTKKEEVTETTRVNNAQLVYKVTSTNGIMRYEVSAVSASGGLMVRMNTTDRMRARLFYYRTKERLQNFTIANHPRHELAGI